MVSASAPAVNSCLILPQWWTVICKLKYLPNCYTCKLLFGQGFIKATNNAHLCHFSSKIIFYFDFNSEPCTTFWVFEQTWNYWGRIGAPDEFRGVPDKGRVEFIKPHKFYIPHSKKKKKNGCSPFFFLSTSFVLLKKNDTTSHMWCSCHHLKRFNSAGKTKRKIKLLSIVPPSYLRKLFLSSVAELRLRCLNNFHDPENVCEGLSWTQHPSPV